VTETGLTTQGETHILLVEDEVDDAIATKRGLPEAAGFRVTHVRTGNDALEAAGRTDFHAALIDHRLPDLSGVELCRRLRSLGFAGPIILLSSVRQDAVIGQAFEAGADDFIVKTSAYGTRLQDAVRSRG